jgi:15-cis-phytoene desaturase
VIVTPPEPFLTMAPEKVLTTICDDARRRGLDLDGHVTDFRVVAHPHNSTVSSPVTWRCG